MAALQEHLDDDQVLDWLAQAEVHVELGGGSAAAAAAAGPGKEVPLWFRGAGGLILLLSLLVQHLFAVDWRVGGLSGAACWMATPGCAGLVMQEPKCVLCLSAAACPT